MIDAYVSLTHYVAHLAPIWEALPETDRGVFWAERRALDELRLRGIPARLGRPARSPRTVLVAGAHDVWTVAKTSRRHQVVLVEHGAGQAYDVDDPGWSGGHRRDGVALFLCPNEVAAGRNRAAGYGAASLAVGSPHVEALQAVRAAYDFSYDDRPVVALSCHHPGIGKAPEAGWALPHYEAALPGVVADLRAAGCEVIGHGHPRALRHFARLWRSLGVEHVRRFEDVLRRASVYVADNSSTLFEAAACGIPVVVLNAPWYRREVDLWPRFWTCADVGVQVDHPGELTAAILTALRDPSPVAAARRWVVSEIYPLGGAGSSARSAAAVLALDA